MGPLENFRTIPMSGGGRCGADLRRFLIRLSQGDFAMYRSVFSRDFFAEMDRLQREVQQAFDLSPTIRGLGRQGFPALNVGTTPEAIEIYAFAPGLDPAKIEVHLERG